MPLQKAYPIILAEENCTQLPRIGPRRFVGKSPKTGPVGGLSFVGTDRDSLVTSIRIAGSEQLVEAVAANYFMSVMEHAMFESIHRGGEVAVTVTGKIDAVGAAVSDCGREIQR